MKIRAPAKINLYLKVLGQREDGYHDLHTVMLPLNLCDELHLEPRLSGITVQAAGCAFPVEENLVHRAARLFLSATGISDGVAIELTKRIPIGGGLGGGSSDAASVFMGLNTLFQAGLSTEELSGLAARLGADCPFFLHGRPLLMGGRGDEPLKELELKDRAYLLVIPPFGMSTASVFAKYKNPLTQGPDFFKISNIQYNKFAPERMLWNDLETVAFEMRPELTLIKQEVKSVDALGVLMSGSGSTIFGVFYNEEHLLDAMRRLRRHAGYSYIPTTRLTGEDYGDHRSKGVPGQG